jgi:hypothetical protein
MFHLNLKLKTMVYLEIKINLGNFQSSRIYNFKLKDLEICLILS